MSQQNPRTSPGRPRETTRKVTSKPNQTGSISEALWSDRVLVNEIRPLGLPLTITECSQACLRMIVVRILQKNRFDAKSRLVKKIGLSGADIFQDPNFPQAFSEISWIRPWDFCNFSDSLKHVDSATYRTFYLTPSSRDSRAGQSRPARN